VTSAQIKARLRQRAKPERVPVLSRFFKTGPGDYGEGDVFIGVPVPDIRQVCRECRGAALDAIVRLLSSRIHEERLLALLLLVDTFKRSDDDVRKAIYERYLASTKFINSWDLVDSSAPQIVGAWLVDKSRAPLLRLARSSSVWERRIAIIATAHFIRLGEFDDTFRIADILLGDDHDLIHKAVGWMLREVGNRDGRAERAFLATRYRQMPRTLLRYAIEKFPERERKKYLSGSGVTRTSDV
jgi:3-methyladenine DNA glycosylase AlkD